MAGKDGAPDLSNYKGIYFNDDPGNKFTDEKTGAHFEFNDMVRRLQKAQEQRKILDERWLIKQQQSRRQTQGTMGSTHGTQFGLDKSGSMASKDQRGSNRSLPKIQMKEQSSMPAVGGQQPEVQMTMEDYMKLMNMIMDKDQKGVSDSTMTDSQRQQILQKLIDKKQRTRSSEKGLGDQSRNKFVGGPNSFQHQLPTNMTMQNFNQTQPLAKTMKGFGTSDQQQMLYRLANQTQGGFQEDNQSVGSNHSGVRGQGHSLHRVGGDQFGSYKGPRGYGNAYTRTRRDAGSLNQKNAMMKTSQFSSLERKTLDSIGRNQKVQGNMITSFEPRKIIASKRGAAGNNQVDMNSLGKLEINNSRNNFGATMRIGQTEQMANIRSSLIKQQLQNKQTGHTQNARNRDQGRISGIATGKSRNLPFKTTNTQQDKLYLSSMLNTKASPIKANHI